MTTGADIRTSIAVMVCLHVINIAVWRIDVAATHGLAARWI